MNQHPQLASLGYNGMPTATAPDFGIKDVWASNMEEEFKKVRQIVQKYPYVAMVSCESFYHKILLVFVIVVVNSAPARSSG